MQAHLIFWVISAVSGSQLCENVMNCTRLATSVADLITVRQTAGCCFHHDCEQGRPLFSPLDLIIISDLFSANFSQVPAFHPWPDPHMLSAWPYYSKIGVHATGVFVCTVILLYGHMYGPMLIWIWFCWRFVVAHNLFITNFAVAGYGKCDWEQKMFQRRSLRGPESNVWQPHHCNNICKKSPSRCICKKQNWWKYIQSSSWTSFLGVPCSF